MLPACKTPLLLVVLVFFMLRCTDDAQWEYGVEQVPDPKNMHGGYVSDPDHILSAAAVEQINAQLSAALF